MNRFYNQLIIIVFVFLFTSCASVIKTTGTFKLNTQVHRIGIVCVTPDKVGKFSNDLCQALKGNLRDLDVSSSVHVIDEMMPVLVNKTSDSAIYNNDTADAVLRINHIRVSLYSGAPCATLMNVAMYTKVNGVDPVWIARIQTEGSNITGPGNPAKVSKEIIAQLLTDGFNK